MDVQAVAQVRRFQRTVTQRIGALDDSFLALDRPLGQSRLLWEIGPSGCEVRDLRERLDLDSGYLSRTLRSLERAGLVSVEPTGPDGRVRVARLTPAGLAERAELDRRSDARAASLLEPLTASQRERLVAAMAEVERLLVASAVAIDALDPAHPSARLCLRAYAEEIDRRFDGGFDPSRGVSAGDDELRPPRGLFLVATLRAEPVGCVAVKLHPGYAHVKRMWVSPAARGMGLGRRLLAEAEARAAGAGLGVVRLDTNRVLTEAIALYRSAGYREVPPFNDDAYAHHWFEKRL
ncbi:GNAT family N-acetyltransferase [Actinomadura kijaniata]|uniref:GNAT family N-acetyltransferase n=1 Tax=Actinomadura kijaniata TaxID=46161 RepID=UPI003F1B8A88